MNGPPTAATAAADRNRRLRLLPRLSSRADRGDSRPNCFP